MFHNGHTLLLLLKLPVVTLLLLYRIFLQILFDLKILNFKYV